VRIGRGLALALAVPVVGLVALAAIFVVGPWTVERFDDDCAFDSERWKRADALRDPDAKFEARAEEAQELVDCGTLTGTRAAEVARVLGRPARESTSRIWFYDLGYPSPRSDWPPLEVHFDAAHRVAFARAPGLAT